MRNIVSSGLVTYTNTLNGIHPSQLHGFFVGWPKPPSSLQHLQILATSTHIWLAHAGAPAAPGQVIGFVNALGDGQLSVYIPLLEVLPAYQGRGIGTELMTRMLGTLDHYYAIDLICDVNLEPFYARFGATRWTGMIWRNQMRLSRVTA